MTYSKYPEPRDAQVFINVQEIDWVLNLPDGLKVVSVSADPFPPRIRVVLEGRSLPPRPVDSEPPWLPTRGQRCECCGAYQLVWGQDEPR